MKTPLLRSDQAEAVAQAGEILAREGGVLIADAPGFGKSFEALGLARSLGLHPLIACPASLRSTWSSYVRRFGMEATYWSHTQLSRWAPADVVTQIPRNTLLIIDEAHAFVNPRTRRYRSAAILAAAMPTVLLTATPFQHRLRDAVHLFALFSSEAAACLRHGSSMCPAADVALWWDRFAIARPRPWTRPVFHVKHVRTIPYDGLDDAAHLATLPGEPTALVRTLLLKRAASSGAALRATLHRLHAYLEAYADAQSMGLALPRRTFARDLPDGQLVFPFLFSPHHEAPPLSASELFDRRQKLSAILAQISTHTPWWDMLRTLEAPVVAFTSYRDTADALYRALTPYRHVIVWTGERLASNYYARLQPHALPLEGAFLIATDVAQTGINLDEARHLVHLDDPWNPTRITQREGRAMRGGNTSPLTVHRYGFSEAQREVCTAIDVRRHRQDLNLRYLHTPAARAVGTSTPRAIRTQLRTQLRSRMRTLDPTWTAPPAPIRPDETRGRHPTWNDDLRYPIAIQWLDVWSEGLAPHVVRRYLARVAKHRMRCWHAHSFT